VAISFARRSSPSPSAKTTWSIAASSAASPPGRIAWCSSAHLAVSGPAGIDEHDPPAALADAADPATHVAERHQASVGRRRVRAEDQEEVGSVDVGYGEACELAEHAQRREQLRVRVLRVGVEAVPRPEQPAEERVAERRAVVVHGGVAGVHAYGVSPKTLLQVVDTLRGFVERLAPRHLLPSRARPSHRMPKPIRVLVDLAQRQGLRADVPAREYVVRVRSDIGHAVTVDRERQPAHRLAQVTRPRHPHGRR
jgi:hypothetical protein